jgi:N-acylneuraminate cytidylyltransferase
MIKKLCIIPARGGSKRIPRKNIKEFSGKPIIAYSIEAAIKSKLFDEVIVSTDDEEIAEISKSYGASIPFFRSKENSSDLATTFDVLEEVFEKLEEQKRFFEYCCCIYPCAPFVKPDMLIASFKKMYENNFDSLFPIIKYGHPIQRALKINQEGKIDHYRSKYTVTRSQDLEEMFHDAGQFYWMRIDEILKYKRVVTEKSGGIVISELEAQDIDSELDWKLAELKFKLLK